MLKHLSIPFQQNFVKENEDYIFYSDDEHGGNYNIDNEFSSSFTTDEELSCCPMCVLQDEENEEENGPNICCTPRSDIKQIMFGFFVGIVVILTTLLAAELSSFALCLLRFFFSKVLLPMCWDNYFSRIGVGFCQNKKMSFAKCYHNG